MPVHPPSADAFLDRHIGPRAADIARMLQVVDAPNIDVFIDEVVPRVIRADALNLPPAIDEASALGQLKGMADRNQVFRSYLGYGYADTITPPVILRNILENPGWYTAYTPYQAEISQGRLEALLIFQTVVTELTGMEISNASLLDEGTAAAEAMTMALRTSNKKGANTFFVSDRCHPQTIAVVRTRALPLGIDVVVGDLRAITDFSPIYAALAQYPATDGSVDDLSDLAETLHANKALLCVATDLLALTLLKPPGELGADIVVGNSQRFGVPLGYGGPHAAFLATRDSYKRNVPGRIIGVSKDAQGNRALRMALQTREQHIRRQTATSNVCTAQVLLSVVAAMYAVWHGPEGLTRIAERIRALLAITAEGARRSGLHVSGQTCFDTLHLLAPTAERRDEVLAEALALGINLRAYGDFGLLIALDEAATEDDVADLLAAMGCGASYDEVAEGADALPIPENLRRTSAFLKPAVFHAHRSETEMLRFIHRLQVKDLSLDASMIPLGSCTMKLNATTEMIPVTWRGFGGLHPFAPKEQAQGYAELFASLEGWLGEVTGFPAISLQPNAGSQGEYAGLLCIRAYHQARGEGHRTICLIPSSAHGTNPASAVMAGMEVVVTACDANGNVDVADLAAKAEKHKDKLAALMITYPSTHGVFEAAVKDICALIHGFGGQVYMDGANMNALVGLARPAQIGADVLHLNLHKTFCIPHGGGGPGMGPIGVAAHLAPYLPGHPLVETGGAGGPVSAAPWGSASILPISWAYIAMMGGEGLTQATRVAILNANYVAVRLRDAYPVLYAGQNGRVAHECILDLRHWKKIGIEAEDVAKRLMDYGFHAPTMSFPVAGTLMIEPTESEGLAELDRFVEAMLAIREEIREIEEGTIASADSALHHAPHTAAVVIASDWSRAYSREKAAFPTEFTRAHKYWPTVARIDNAYGDRNLFCSCAMPGEE
jgi:glycine dehydrogenase